MPEIAFVIAQRELLLQHFEVFNPTVAMLLFLPNISVGVLFKYQRILCRVFCYSMSKILLLYLGLMVSVPFLQVTIYNNTIRQKCCLDHLL